jgi:hypothetical protein
MLSEFDGSVTKLVENLSGQALKVQILDEQTKKLGRMKDKILSNSETQYIDEVLIRSVGLKI